MREESKEAHQEEEDTLIEVSLEEKDGNQIGREVTAEEGTILDQETEEAQAEIKEVCASGIDRYKLGQS